MTGKHVVVTGAGTGIGRATALRLAQEGAAVTLMGLDGLEETASSIDGPSHVERCDIRDRRAVDAAVARAAAALGRLDAFVAVSGIGGPNAESDEGATGSTTSSARI